MYLIKEKIKQHLLELSSEDRYCRFGTAVNDDFITKYVEGLEPSDHLFYSLDYSGKVIAFLHLAKYGDSSADVGITVSPDYRNKGYGRLLFRRAVSESKLRGIKKLYVYFLADNYAMGKLAKRENLGVFPYSDQVRAEMQVPQATLFDFYGNIVTESIVLMDNTYKQIFSGVTNASNV